MSNVMKLKSTTEQVLKAIEGTMVRLDKAIADPVQYGSNGVEKLLYQIATLNRMLPSDLHVRVTTADFEERARELVNAAKGAKYAAPTEVKCTSVGVYDVDDPQNFTLIFRKPDGETVKCRGIYLGSTNHKDTLAALGEMFMAKSESTEGAAA